jgi:hypothetical protein
MSVHDKDPLLWADLFEAWNDNPEPEVGKPSGHVITEAKQNQEQAYVWSAKNKDEWIAFEGDTEAIER